MSDIPAPRIRLFDSDRALALPEAVAFMVVGAFENGLAAVNLEAVEFPAPNGCRVTHFEYRSPTGRCLGRYPISRIIHCPPGGTVRFEAQSLRIDLDTVVGHSVATRAN